MVVKAATESICHFGAEIDRRNGTCPEYECAFCNREWFEVSRGRLDPRRVSEQEAQDALMNRERQSAILSLGLGSGRRSTLGKCLRPAKNVTCNSTRTPGRPRISTRGAAHGDRRGQCGPGSKRGDRHAGRLPK